MAGGVRPQSFGAADVARIYEDIIVHEIGHVLGFVGLQHGNAGEAHARRVLDFLNAKFPSQWPAKTVPLSGPHWLPCMRPDVMTAYGQGLTSASGPKIGDITIEAMRARWDYTPEDLEYLVTKAAFPCFGSNS